MKCEHFKCKDDAEHIVSVYVDGCIELLCDTHCVQNLDNAIKNDLSYLTRRLVTEDPNEV